MRTLVLIVAAAALSARSLSASVASPAGWRSARITKARHQFNCGECRQRYQIEGEIGPIHSKRFMHVSTLPKQCALSLERISNRWMDMQEII